MEDIREANREVESAPVEQIQMTRENKVRMIIMRQGRKWNKWSDVHEWIGRVAGRGQSWSFKKRESNG